MRDRDFDSDRADIHPGDATLFFETLLLTIDEAVLIEDELGATRCINPQLCRIFDIPTRTETLLEQDASLVHAHIVDHLVDGDAFLTHAAQIMGTAIAIRGERFELLDGRVVERDYTPIALDDRVYCHLWVFREILVESSVGLRAA